MGSINVHRKDSTVVLELANQKKANALDFAMLGQMEQEVSLLEDDPSIRLLLIQGTQGGTFCGGADIKDWSSLTPEQFGADWLDRGNRLFNRIERLPFITASLIEGLCLGGGLELALCTDLRIATPAATFALPETGIGAFPGWLGGPRLERVIGKGLALEMVLLGRKLDAFKAHERGLVHQVTAGDQLGAAVAELAVRSREVSREAVRASKGAFYCNEPLQYHANAGTRLRATHDAAEGLRAFLKKKTEL